MSHNPPFKYPHGFTTVRRPPDRFAAIRLDELAALPHNWDSYGGIPPLGNCLAKAREILPYLAGDWSIVPMSNGGIQLEQHCDGLDIELMIENSPSGAKGDSKK